LYSDRRGRRRRRAQVFGVRHPRLSLVILSALLAGAIAVCGYQLSYGTYLGRGWVIAALAGMAATAGLGAAVLIRSRRHGPAAGRVGTAWPAVVLGLASPLAIRFPFPQGPYGSVQAFFDEVHAALLGCELVTCTAVVALFACLLLKPAAVLRRRPGGPDA
jgi:hypothetical protein